MGLNTLTIYYTIYLLQNDIFIIDHRNVVSWMRGRGGGRVNYKQAVAERVHDGA